MFRSRWNSYKVNSRKSCRGEDWVQIYLFKHSSYQVILAFFKIPGHTGFFTYVTLIGKTNTRAPTKREDYWIHTLKTKPPMGLNVEDGYWVYIFHSYCTVIYFPGFGRLVLALFLVYSDYGYIYFILSFKTVLVLFCLLRWRFLWKS